MRKLSIILFALVTINNTIAKPCLPEGITFDYQWQIDNFQTNYPGCTEIEGDVLIGTNGSSIITDLDGLNVIESIGGDLVLWENWSLTDFSGLNNVVSVAGNLILFGCHSITVLSEFNSLQSIGGGLSITNNANQGLKL